MQTEITSPSSQDSTKSECLSNIL